MSRGWELPGYTVGRLIGFGPDAEVWQAVRDEDRAAVALKRLHGVDPAARERLRRDVAVVGSLALPHVVRVLDVVDADDSVVVVCELASGRSLADLLAARGRLTAGEVVTVLAPIAQTLAVAHGRGVVHGRVSASNVVFTAPGRPLLC